MDSAYWVPAHLHFRGKSISVPCRVRKPSFPVRYLIDLVGPEAAQGLFTLSALEWPGPEASISFEQTWTLLNNNIRFKQDETHSLASRPHRSGTFEVLASSMSQADDFGDGLRRFQLASELLNSEILLQIEMTRSGLRLSVTCPFMSQPSGALYSELWIMVLHCLCLWLTGEVIHVRWIELPRSGAADLGTMLALLDKPIRLSSSEAVVIVYAAEAAVAKLLPRKIQHYESEAEAIYRRLSKAARTQDRLASDQDFVDLVRRAFDTGQTHQSSIARHLGVSAASLRRHLSFRGTTFRSLLEAHRLCQDQALSAAHVLSDEAARLLGYSDSRSLRRARQRWRSQAPLNPPSMSEIVRPD